MSARHVQSSPSSCVLLRFFFSYEVQSQKLNRTRLPIIAFFMLGKIMTAKENSWCEIFAGYIEPQAVYSIL